MTTQNALCGCKLPCASHAVIICQVRGQADCFKFVWRYIIHERLVVPPVVLSDFGFLKRIWSLKSGRYCSTGECLQGCKLLLAYDWEVLGGREGRSACEYLIIGSLIIPIKVNEMIVYCCFFSIPFYGSFLENVLLTTRGFFFSVVKFLFALVLLSTVVAAAASFRTRSWYETGALSSFPHHILHLLPPLSGQDLSPQHHRIDEVTSSSTQRSATCTNTAPIPLPSPSQPLPSQPWDRRSLAASNR